MLALETGAILVSESGTGVHDSRVTAFDTDGNRLTLIEGLPSGLAFPNNDPSGASGLALRNHTLYISISAGDSGMAGPVQGSEIPNPNKSSPIFSSVLALEFDRNLSGVTAPFRVTPADHQALARRERVALVNERGERATLRLVVDIPDHLPEPRPDSPQNARTSNPFALEPDGSCALWLVDASRNLIWKVDICENTFSTLATFPPTTNPTPVGPPRIDAVPTSARTWNGDLLVSFLSGAPFLQGLGQVRLVKPSTGEHTPFFTGLRTVVDVLPFGGETRRLLRAGVLARSAGGAARTRAVVRLADGRAGHLRGRPGHAGQHGDRSQDGRPADQPAGPGTRRGAPDTTVTIRAARPFHGRSDMARWIFALAFVLVCYGNGAACVESFVNYPSWRLIGASEFTAYHAFIGPRVIAFLVAPALLGTVCTALLLRSRPAAIPLWSVWVAVALQMVIWLSTATIQWPIQQDLHAHGFSAPLVERLIETNLWLRRLPYAACAVVFLWMAARVAAPEARHCSRPPDHRMALRTRVR